MASDAVSEIRNRLDIVDLVQQYVPGLKRTGRSMKGLCPFHQEKTPSFVVFPDSQNFHCFGCGKGGDLFTFFMLVEGVEFREALKDLAARAGVELQQGGFATPHHDEQRAKLVSANELAATYFHHILTKAPQGEPGRKMLKERGISDEMVERFRLGFAPDSWELLFNFLGSRSVETDIAVQAGLVQERQSGGHYDRFRNRFMFPISNRDSEIVGFGGRALGDDTPKYLNSPQTPVFDKSSLVYGLHLAREHVRKAEHVVIVEGYMDVIAAHQFGYQNVVASMGTALTEAQVSQVRRGAKRIVMALDADAAGQMATLRGLETMSGSIEDEREQQATSAFGIVRFERKMKTEIAIARLPEGQDPDDFIRQHPDEWPALITRAQPFLDFTIDILTADVATSDARGKSEAVHRIAPLFRQLTDRVMQAHYVGELARKLRLDERMVLSEIRRTNMAGRERALRQQVSQESESIDGRARERTNEDYLTALLLRHHLLTKDIVQSVPFDDIHDARNRAILETIATEDLSGMTAEQFVVALDDKIAEHADYLLSSLEGRPEQFPGQIRIETSQILSILGKERFDFLLRQLQENLREAVQSGDSSTIDVLKEQLRSLAERHQNYYPPVSPYFKDTRSPAT